MIVIDIDLIVARAVEEFPAKLKKVPASDEVRQPLLNTSQYFLVSRIVYNNKIMQRVVTTGLLGICGLTVSPGLQCSTSSFWISQKKK